MLCKMYTALRSCKNGNDCPFAHSHKELDVEYKPVEWVKIFRPATSTQGLRSRSYKRTNIREALETSGDQSSYLMTYQDSPGQEGKEAQINKVINTVE